MNSEITALIDTVMSDAHGNKTAALEALCDADYLADYFGGYDETEEEAEEHRVIVDTAYERIEAEYE